MRRGGAPERTAEHVGHVEGGEDGYGVSLSGDLIRDVIQHEPGVRAVPLPESLPHLEHQVADDPVLVAGW